MRSRLLRPMAAVAAVVTIVATGVCAPGPAPAPATAPFPAATLVPLPAPRAVPNVEARSEQVLDPSTHSAISYPTLPTDPPLQNAVRTAIDNTRASYAATNAGGLFVTWQIAAAAGSVLGIRVSSVVTGSEPIGSSTTWYGDANSQQVWASEDLIREDAKDLLATVTAKAFWRGGLINETPSVDPSVLVHDVVFDPTGALVLTVPEGAIAPPALGRRAVRLAPELTASILTKAGKAVRDAVVSGQPVAQTKPSVVSAAPAPAPAAAKAPFITMDGADCSVLACVALTFDDGPGPYTMALLDQLDAAGVKATFFVVGRNAHQHPDIVAAEIARGHDVGGHSWAHSKLTTMPPEQVAADTQLTSAAISGAGGTAPFMRPPYGAKDQAVLDAIGVPAILWDVDTLDWQNRDVAQTTANALAGAQPGSIILFHDIHESTVQAIPGIIAELRARGLVPVTVSELFAGQELLPGHSYRSRAY